MLRLYWQEADYYIEEEPLDFAAFFAFILSHFSFAVNFGLFDLLTPLSMFFAIRTLLG